MKFENSKYKFISTIQFKDKKTDRKSIKKLKFNAPRHASGH